jgi:molybdopterin-guanine dinucleotide biosynthesis protein A
MTGVPGAPAATGAVMAGGRSSRLGRDKALLTINGETLLVRAVRTLHSVTAEQIVVGPPDRATQAGGVRAVPDEYPGSGPLGGIYSALRAASHEYLLVVACDMPFLNPALLAHLLTLAPAHDVVLPRLQGRGEQLHAVYRRTCLDPIRRQIERGDYKIDRFFAEVDVRDVDEDELRRYDPDLHSLRNVNTADDWAEAQRLLSRGGSGPPAAPR